MAEEITMKDRDEAWRALFEAAAHVKEILVADNGGSEEVDPEDEWLAEMIAEMNKILAWDPEASHDYFGIREERDLNKEHDAYESWTWGG
jgi:hypothetical protein